MLTLLFGVMPGLVFDLTEGTALRVLEFFNRAAGG
jgi:hypothetical protein